MHLVIGGVIDLDRQERPRANMKRECFTGDPPRVDCRHQSVGEMERGGRRRYRPGFAREHRLVIGGVIGISRAL